ncbi:MAG: hypothetical protein WKF30_03015 [Pyrinomonadaceae bacterium]
MPRKVVPVVAIETEAALVANPMRITAASPATREKAISAGGCAECADAPSAGLATRLGLVVVVEGQNTCCAKAQGETTSAQSNASAVIFDLGITFITLERVTIKRGEKLTA